MPKYKINNSGFAFQLILVPLTLLIIIGVLYIRPWITKTDNQETRLAVTTPQNVKAFPGAEGYGSDTKGGRGGKVYKVTNLKSSGPGSLREALTAKGPRIVVFEVGGVIDLYNDNINIKGEDMSYLTVLGQTAPGEGIIIKGSIDISDAHDIVVRYIRIRPEDPGAPDSESTDALGITGNSYKIVLDHNSFSWATDENLEFYNEAGNKKTLSNIVYQWNLIAEGDADSTHPESGKGDGAHSAGQLLSPRSFTEKIENISIHKNLYMHNNTRNPLIQKGSPGNSADTTGIFRFINNVVYNWKDGASEFHPENGGIIRFDLINNYYRPGPDTMTKKYKQGVWCYGDATSDYGKCSLYYSGNIYQELLGAKSTLEPFLWNRNGSAVVIDKKTNPQGSDGISILSTEDAYNKAVERAGAALPANNSLGRTGITRDAVDARLISELQSAKGKIGIGSDGVRKYPTATYKTSLTDTDLDGMPDTWETSQGLNPNANDSAQDKNNNGYTNIEDYANSLAWYPSDSVTSPTPTPLVTSTPTVTATPAPTNTPTAAPSPTPTPKINSSITFNGSGGHISMGDPGNGKLDFGTGDFTLETWLKTSSTSNFTLIQKGGDAPTSAGYWLWHNPGTKQLRLYISDGVTRMYGAATLASALESNTWRHVAVTVARSSNAIFYVDGIEVGRTSITAFTGKSLSNSSAFELSLSDDVNYDLNGSLDEVRVWNVARTAQQIKDSMYTEFTTIPSNLVGYWQLNENSGTTVSDLSGNGNNGKFSSIGATWNSTGFPKK